ncbi:MAG: thiol peroxidase [Flavobacteriales bacterium]|nr:thiol peroxidase [Flavobacteriales bacterium]
MADITLGGTPCKTSGELPSIGTKAPAFELRNDDLSPFHSSSLAGKRAILNVFPSVDTGVCAMSSRKFNAEASALDNTVVACISRDLPFAMKRFCGAEGLEDIKMLSDFSTGKFGKDYGLEIVDGGFSGLHSRCVLVLDENGTVIYSEQVPEIGQEPNYEAALTAVKQ